MASLKIPKPTAGMLEGTNPSLRDIQNFDIETYEPGKNGNIACHRRRVCGASSTSSVLAKSGGDDRICISRLDFFDGQTALWTSLCEFRPGALRLPPGAVPLLPGQLMVGHATDRHMACTAGCGTLPQINAQIVQCGHRHAQSRLKRITLVLQPSRRKVRELLDIAMRALNLA